MSMDNILVRDVKGDLDSTKVVEHAPGSLSRVPEESDYRSGIEYDIYRISLEGEVSESRETGEDAMLDQLEWDLSRIYNISFMTFM